jgi:hypothetical protein
MKPDDDMQRQLGAADPLPPEVPLDPAFLARMRARIEEERLMSTPTPTRRPERAHPRGARPTWVPFAVIGGAVALSALALGVVINVSGDDDSPAADAPVTTPVPTDPPSTPEPATPAPTTPEPTTPPQTPAVVDRPPGLEPAPPAADPSMMMCLPFSAESIAEAPLAFDGVVVAVDGTEVTFDVLEWFRGGSGDILVTDGVYMTGDNVALIGGPPAEVGQRYLVAAELYSDAVRPGACGWVRLYSADMAATYAQAFTA